VETRLQWIKQPCPESFDWQNSGISENVFEKVGALSAEARRKKESECLLHFHKAQFTYLFLPQLSASLI
jgi:hypothetical protein